MYGLDHTRDPGEAGAVGRRVLTILRSSHEVRCYRSGVRLKPYVNIALRVGRTRGCSRAHPLVNHLPRLFAQLELGAVASFVFDKSNTHSSDVKCTV